MLIEKNVVPVLRINNRTVNQTFFEKNLGLKTVLEEGAFTEFAGHGANKKVQLILVESPSMRTRAVKGTKKLERITLKVDNPSEIESLLAAGASFSKLYRGKNGLAFESISPEGDRFLLHGEESAADLKEILPPHTFEARADFVGLTDFTVSQILINTPNAQASQAYYQKILSDQCNLSFQLAQGQDLLAAADSTWDLDSLRIRIAKDYDWSQLENRLTADYFKDKKESFLQTTDPNNIEIWFEK